MQSAVCRWRLHVIITLQQLKASLQLLRFSSGIFVHMIDIVPLFQIAGEMMKLGEEEEAFTYIQIRSGNVYFFQLDMDLKVIRLVLMFLPCC